MDWKYTRLSHIDKIPLLKTNISIISSGIPLLQTLPKVCPSLDKLQRPKQLRILLLGIEDWEQDGSH